MGKEDRLTPTSAGSTLGFSESSTAIWHPHPGAHLLWGSNMWGTGWFRGRRRDQPIAEGWQNKTPTCRRNRMKSIDRLPPVHAPTGDWTCNLGYVPWMGIKLVTFLVYGMMLQPTEPPGPGWNHFWEPNTGSLFPVSSLTALCYVTFHFGYPFIHWETN